MKYSIISVGIILLFASNLFAQKKEITSGNPIIKGWYADPEAIIIKNQYWIYPTYSDKYKKQVFFDAFSSKDLVTWKKHSHILDTSAIKWAYMAMWAPAIVEKDKKYFLFFSANDIQSKERNGVKDDTLGGIGIAVANNPDGPYKDYLGKPLINQFYNGAQPIDQFVFKDKDGQYYIIYGGWGHCNIAKLKKDFTAIVPINDSTNFKEITPEGYIEGPFMFIRNNKYYFMWSEGGWTGPDYSVAYAIADSPFGPFKRVGKILQQDSTIATGAGHHSIMHNAKKDLWYIVYHRRPLGETAANNRTTCIEQMYFDEKGFIKSVELSFTGVNKQKL
jgi:beta-xylosidase